VRIWLNPSRHCWATTLLSSRRTGDSRTDSSHGGGSPAYTTTVREALGARALPNAIPTAVEDRPCRLPVASFPWFVYTAVSGQIGFLLSCRSHRMKHRHKWCTVAHVLVLSSRQPWRPGGFVWPDWAVVEGTLRSHRILDGRSRLERK
jgi:hypothetical protein